MQPTIRQIKGFGWRRDHLDGRDHMLTITAQVPLPAVFDLRSSPYMPPIYDQGDLGCHDDKTEVLTESGWLPWASCTHETALGTMNPTTQELEFQQPTNLHRYEYDGELYYSDRRSLDFALTPNHRMYVRGRDWRTQHLKTEYAFQRIDSLKSYVGLPATTSGWIGAELGKITIGNREFDGDDLIALISLVVSDGHVPSPEATDKTQIGFCCFREDRLRMVESLAQRLSISGNNGTGSKNRWNFRSAELAEWFRQTCYTGSHLASRKRIPQIIKCASQRQIRLFLEYFGDQSRCQSPHQYFSTSKAMIDDLQELLLRIGKRSSIWTDRPGRIAVRKDGVEIKTSSPEIFLSEWETTRLSIRKGEGTLITDRYRGEVFCATVPNGLLVTRRNNSVLISGNSCTANAGSRCVDFERKRQGLAFMTPSRMMIYYNTRVIEGTQDQDAGGELRDVMKTLASQGTCAESEWAYEDSNLTVKPPAECYTNALKFEATQYSRVTQQEYFLKHSLSILRRPVMFGMSVFEQIQSDEAAATGVITMPSANASPVGGHALCLAGFDDTRRHFTVANSWSASWGKKGYGFIDYEYILNPNLASDFWVLLAEEPTA